MLGAASKAFHFQSFNRRLWKNELSYVIDSDHLYIIPLGTLINKVRKRFKNFSALNLCVLQQQSH